MGAIHAAHDGGAHGREAVRACGRERTWVHPEGLKGERGGIQKGGKASMEASRRSGGKESVVACEKGGTGEQKGEVEKGGRLGTSEAARERAIK